MEILLKGSLRIAGLDGIDACRLQQAALVPSTATELAMRLGVSSVTISVKASSVGAMSGQSCRPPPTTPQPQAPATVTYVVKMTLSLPMSKADFTSDKQALCKKSIAAGALHVHVCCP